MPELPARDDRSRKGSGSPKRLPTKSSEAWRWAYVVHLLTLALGFSLLLWVNRHQWFSSDDWVVLTERLFGPDIPGVLEPYNESWFTIPLLIYRALYSFVGARTYLPYIAVALLLHVGVVHLLWRVMRSSDVDPWIATGTSAMFLVFAAGAENLLWASPLNFIGPLLLGLGHLILVDHDGPFDRRDLAGWGLSLISLMFGTIAVPMTAVVGIVALFRRGWKALVITVAPAATVFAVWLAILGRSSYGGVEPSVETLLRLPLYVFIAIRKTIQGLATSELGLAWLLPILILLGALGWMRRRSIPAAPVACAFGPILLFMLTGLGRISRYGIAQGASSRYVYVAGALLLPLVALGLTAIGNINRTARIAVLLFVSYAALTNFRLLQAVAENEARREKFLKELTVAASVPSAFQGPILEKTISAPYLGPPYSAPISLEGLATLQRDGALPDIPIPADVSLYVAADLQVTLTDEPQLASEDRSATLIGSEGNELTHGGCVSIGPDQTLQWPTAFVSIIEPTSLSIRSETGGRIEVLIRKGQAISPLPRTFRLSEGRTFFLNVGIPGSQAIVRLIPVGASTVCNLRSA